MHRCFLASLFLSLIASWTNADEPRPGATAWVYVGTYTGKSSKGIYKLELDLATGKLTDRGLAAEQNNPSFLALHPNQRFLYCVNEVGSINKQKGGGISALAIDPKTGDLKLLNQQSSVGTGPCHLTVDKMGKFVLAANYGGGSTVVLPVQADGSLAEKSAFIQHEGKGQTPRQSAPHAHSVHLDSANRFAFVADLGLDKVLIYRFDGERGTLSPNDPPFTALAPGAGPRHFAFHPTGKFAYVINEMNMTVTAMTYDADKGSLEKVQSISTLPMGVKNQPGYSTAEVVVHPSGKFLYGSNRGHNSIAVFAINEKTGELTAKGHQNHLVNTPRNFAIDPTGKWLLVGSQGTGKVVVFSIDGQTGALGVTDQVVDVPSPVCIRFLLK